MKRVTLKFQVGLLLIAMLISCNTQSPRESIDLSGDWRFELDSTAVGVEQRWYQRELADLVSLPGTTDTNQKGELNETCDETRYLSRIYHYSGKAWYQREIQIPSSWQDGVVELYVERTKPSTLWIDQHIVGECRSLNTPHLYDITDYVKDGESHTITIQVDNGASSLHKAVFNSHNATEHTQTNWNGMVGKIELRSKSSRNIGSVTLTPNVSDKTLDVKLSIKGERSQQKGYSIALQCISSSDDKSKVERREYELHSDTLNISYPMGDSPLLWSEFAPNLYECHIELIEDGRVIDVVSENFGMREFVAKGLHLYNNGARVSLRGKHDGAVFPTTGYAPMNRDEWRRYLTICKEYGMNHVRFHSWTPPIACVEMADSLGLYLQIELPFWGGLYKFDAPLKRYLKQEAASITQRYANHPSVVLFSLGNELNGDKPSLREVARVVKDLRPDLLVATGTNNFLGSQNSDPYDDFFVTCRVGGNKNEPDYKKHVRGSFSHYDAPQGGYINNTYPNSLMNFDSALTQAKVPVISHETGQFQCYPIFEERSKYRGVLEARNYDVFRERVERAGLIDQAADFVRASGALQAILYKADIEMSLRTEGLSGFQVLDLQDYSGQGTALVGVLDAFMESKGAITSTEWRRFCSAVVPLVELDKFVYTAGEKVTARAKIYNYSNVDLTEGSKWTLMDEKERVVASGTFETTAPKGSLTNVGEICFDMPSVELSQKLTLEYDCGGVDGANSYNLWVYSTCEEVETNRFTLIQEVGAELYKQLEAGATVMFMPKADQLRDQTIDGLFQTDYWNYRMFRQISVRNGAKPSPGTLGLLIDDTHPSLKSFPTSYHSDMQWYSIVKGSHPLIMDMLPHFEPPIVQVIDNVERNHKLGLIFECRVGRGKLLVCMSDLLSLSKYPEAQTLYRSLCEYITSAEFNPSVEYSSDDIEQLLTQPTAERELAELQNSSYTYKK